MAYRIKTNERVAFVGKTGSGKTYAARSLLRHSSRLIVFDSKGTVNNDEWRTTDWNRVSAWKLKRGNDIRIRVPHPLDGNYEPYFKAAYEAGNCTIYIDEMYGVIGRSTRPEQYLTAVYTRGRELGIGVWAATQRPSWVPLFMLSEADWLFCFRLQMHEDRKRMAELMGEELRMENIAKYHFWLYNGEWDSPKLYRGIESANIKEN